MLSLRSQSRIRLIALIVVSCSALVAVGCRSTMKGLRIDPSFSHDNLETGRLAVGGITSLVHDVYDRAAWRSKINNTLFREIAEERNELQLASPGVVRNSIGSDRLEELLDDYRLAGDMSAPALAELRDVLTGVARYIAFARIEDDVTKESREEKEETVDNKVYRVTTMASTRKVSMDFKVYDLQTAQTIWSALLEDQRSTTEPYRELVRVENDESDSTNTQDVVEEVAVVVSEILGTERHEYPAPPELAEVTRPIFVSFAHGLPKSPKPAKPQKPKKETEPVAEKKSMWN